MQLQAGELAERAFSRAFYFTALSVISTCFPLSLAARQELCLLMTTGVEARTVPGASVAAHPGPWNWCHDSLRRGRCGLLGCGKR